MTSNSPHPPVPDIRLGRFLQVNVALLTAFGTVLLGTGQMGTHSVLLSLMAVFAASTAVIFTDILGWFRINRTLANLAAIAAVGFSLTDFFGNDAEYQLLAVANLLVYLQIVLLYQEKNERIYWQLMVLSLLQVVVSAALNLGFQFGVLIVAYMFVAFAAMCLFFFYRESLRFLATDAGGRDPGAALRPQPNPARRRRRGRWPLRPTARPLTFRFSGNLADILQGRQLLRQVLSMGLMTLLFSVCFFFALPRLSNSVWQRPQGLSRSIVGFSQEVTLNSLSNLFESEEEVLRVSFIDQQTNQPVRLRSGPYLRGSVLVHYYCGNGKWRQIQWTQRYRGETLPGPPIGQTVVLQDFKLQPQPNPVLFAAYPVYDVPGTPIQVKTDPSTWQLIRDDFELAPRGVYQYELGTTGIRNREQLPLQTAGRHYEALERTYLERFEPQLCPTIKRVAEEVVAAEGIADDDAYRQALALENHFHDPGRYTYSLNQLGVTRNPAVDPVEDFVANHRTGHCEYFASALVLMLRSRGIPARMVVGYRAAEYNSLGNFYQVREKDAHAWAEAFLEFDQVPEPLRQQAGITFQGSVAAAGTNADHGRAGRCGRRVDPLGPPGGVEELHPGSVVRLRAGTERRAATTGGLRAVRAAVVRGGEESVRRARAGGSEWQGSPAGDWADSWRERP